MGPKRTSLAARKISSPGGPEPVALGARRPKRSGQHDETLLEDIRRLTGLDSRHEAQHRPGFRLRAVTITPHGAGPKPRKMEEQDMARMPKAGVIQPSKSEWASPVVLEPKPDGSVRFWIKDRCLNALTRTDPYPIPRMDDCIDSLGDPKIFSAMEKFRILTNPNFGRGLGEDFSVRAGFLRVGPNAFRTH